MRRAAAMLLLATACSPATTRPPFGPLPQATRVVFVGEPPDVTREAATWIAAAGVRIVRVSDVDRYIETDWYPPPPDSGAATAFPFPVKTRVWAEPAGSGRTNVIIETVYRPVEDPSRPARDLEVAVPRDAGDDPVARRLLAALREKFEVL